VGDTLGKIALHQVFDFDTTASQASSSARRYSLVWGSHMPASWRSANASLLASYYFIMVQSTSSRNLAWYRTNHPDWILYNCTASGAPTTTPAYMQAGAYGTNVPLDIHNPAVQSFMIRSLAVPAAVAGHYNAIAVDQVVFQNFMGGNAGAGSYGCGVYSHGSFVRRYASKADPAWATDIVAWMKTAHTILTTDPTISRYHLKIVANHPAGSLTDSRELTLLANVDAGLSEVGFTDYSKYTTIPSLFKQVYNYMSYEQAHGVTALIIDKFVQSAALTPVQREWAVGTYLMVNNGNALLYATNGGGGTGGYGSLHYYPEYNANLGMPCGAMTGGPSIYMRKFHNGLVVLNANTGAATTTLPAHVYHDITGRPVSSVLTVPGTNAYVMTTLANTGCL